MSRTEKKKKSRRPRPSQRPAKPLRASIGERLGGALRQLFTRKAAAQETPPETSAKQGQPVPVEVSPSATIDTGIIGPAANRKSPGATNNHRRSDGRRGKRGQRHRNPQRGLNRLAAEIGFIASQRNVRAELLPGAPATVALQRGGNLLAMLVVGDEKRARKILDLPASQQRDRGADLLWELDRRAPSLTEVGHAN